MSRRVASLERSLGVRLLERTTRTLRLTDAGGPYYEHCKRLVAEAEEANQQLSKGASLPRGTLRISAPELFIEPLVRPTATELLRRHGDLQVECASEARYVDLIAERIDVAIRIVTPKDRSSLRARRLGSVPLVLCASPRLLQRHGEPRSPTKLSSLPLCAFGHERGQVRWQLIDRRGRTAEFRGSPRLLTTSDALLRAACLEGFGVALVPAFTVSDDLAQGRLVRVLPGWSGAPLNLFAVTSNSPITTPRVRAYLDILIEHVRHRPRMFEP